MRALEAKDEDVSAIAVSNGQTKESKPNAGGSYDNEKKNTDGSMTVGLLTRFGAIQAIGRAGDIGKRL